MKILIIYRCWDKIGNCPSSTKFNSTPLHIWWTSIIFSMNIIYTHFLILYKPWKIFSLLFMKLSAEIWKPINRIRILIRANTIIAVRATGEAKQYSILVFKFKLTRTNRKNKILFEIVFISNTNRSQNYRSELQTWRWTIQFEYPVCLVGSLDQLRGEVERQLVGPRRPVQVGRGALHHITLSLHALH